MITGGVDVDIETGLPLGAKKTNVDQAIADSSRMEMEANDLLTELHSPEGLRIVQEITSYLEKRIDDLVAADAECRSLMRVLANIGHKIHAADRAAMIRDKLLRYKVAP